MRLLRATVFVTISCSIAFAGAHGGYGEHGGGWHHGDGGGAWHHDGHGDGRHGGGGQFSPSTTWRPGRGRNRWIALFDLDCILS